jgi:hypothetical protein
MRLLLWALSWVVAMFSTVGVAWPAAPVVDVQDTVRRTLQWSSAGDHLLEVSNISGSIRIVASDRRDIELVAERTIHADSDAAASDAKRDVRLDVSESAGTVRVCADAERCGCRTSDRSTDRWSFGRWREDRYRVEIDFELRVPKDTRLMVCTINGGRVTIDGAAGDFDVRNVNGGIDMTGITGSGRAETVNGSLNASFAANPKSASSFKTVNGDIVVAFPRTLAADLRLKTFNGGLYTDFDVTPLAPAPAAERRNGRFVYRTNQFAAVRVGQGGPELTFEGFNGDVRVIEKK